MPNKGLTWKYILFLMANGLVTCLLVLFVLYKRRGHFSYLDIIAVTFAFVFSCSLLLILSRPWQKVRVEDDLPQKE
ncbi:MAG: hypothetical protein PVH77_10050 [Phycisphaerales bacterium]|jgi:hypothetical protein